MRIIVVDDKEEERYLAETLLKGSGYQVETAVNGAEALEKLRTEGFGMIVSDVLMPVMDGFRLCRECKGDEKLKDIPFIFYTATYKDERDEELASKVGADKYIRKPIEPEEFVKIVQGLFRDVEEGKIGPKKRVLEEEKEVLKLYSERLIEKLEKKMLDLEAETAQRKQAQERIEHLNRVLRAIRRVNQLIVKEKDYQRLLKEACDNLTKTGGYYNAWIAILDESGGLVTTTEAGLGEDFLPVVQQLKRGELITCAQQALVQAGVVAIKDPFSTCGDCPLAKKYRGRGAMTIRLEHNEKVYGLLVTSVPTGFAADEEEQSLLREVAGDIAFALHNMELEEERKQAEESLQAAEQNFRNSLDSSPLGIRIVNSEGELLYANQAILDIYGYSSIKELKATPTKQRYTPQSYAEHQERKEKRKLGKTIPSNYEISIVRKDGEVRHLVASRKEVLWNSEVQYQTIYQDITERKQAEEVLRKAKEQAEQYLSIAEVMLATVDADENITLMNKKGYEILGYKEGELIGKNWFDTLVPKRIRGEVRDVFRRLMAGGIEPVEYYENPLLTKDGDERLIAFHNTVVRDPNGQIVGALLSAEDITERKQAEVELRESKEFSDSLITSMQDGFSVLDPNGVHIDVNPALCNMTGFSKEELIGVGPPHPYWSPEKHEEIEKAFEKTLVGEFGSFELTFMRKNGERFPVIISPSWMKDEHGNIISYHATIKDITERKKMEEQLIVTDRLASIGELSSGIAHELNNPLTSVIGFSELLLDKDVPDDIKEDLRVINREAQRTAGVVRNLLTFARKHPQEKESVDINSTIEKVLELRAYEQKVNNIQIDIQFAPDLPEIIANTFDLQQVFLNIIINAEHFMKEAHGRGTLTVTTERVGDIIRASFADDGPGIAKENLGHLFDPFFTTKEVGKGTGLGLSICHGIITEHGGRIYAESELGKGATFVIELPVKNVDTGGTTNENS